jgi:phenylacetate-CoA ligase
MSFFRLRTLPGYRWPPLPDAAMSPVWVAYLELERSQWLRPAEIQQRQLEQARALLQHCKSHVPYYRQLLSERGIDPEAIRTMDSFRHIPLLPRRTYQENVAAFVAEQLPPGTVAANSPQTSGSSGTPTRVFLTNMTNLWWCASYLRDLEWCRIDPSGTIAAIRSTGPLVDQVPQLMEGVTVPCWLAQLEGLIETGAAHGMDIRQDQRRQLQWLRDLSPDYLLSYPSNLEVLAALVRDAGRIPSLRAIQSISDTLTEEAQANIEAAFGVPVKNTYTCTEAGYLASPCPAGQGLHVHAENVILEVLDEAGQPCGPGQSGRVFITSLHNLRGPLVRYELGDEATVGPENCACGRGLPLLARVQGKNSPMFRLADGRLKSSAPVARLVRKVGGHWQHQVVQKAVDHVVVRLAVDATWTQAHAEQLLHKLQEYFEAPVRVDLELHERLPMPPSGKFQSMLTLS